MKHYYFSAALAVCLLPGSAMAGDDGIREAIECKPAKKIIKFMKKLDDMKPKRMDTVESRVSAFIDVKDGEALPDRIFITDAAGSVPLTLEADGKVPDFSRIKTLSEDGELCVEDQARAGQPKDKDAFKFGVSTDVKFKNNSGTHTIAEIADGVDDGKSHYKKSVPGPFALMVPSMTHVMVNYKTKGTPAQISATRAGSPIDGLIIERFAGAHIISLEHLQDLGADTLNVAGGAYSLEPVPSIKKMKSLGFTDSEDGDDEDAAE